MPYPELLSYAQRIALFTSAPPNMPDLAIPGQPPPPLFFPPFPNEEKMRRGRMNDEAPLGMIGETHSVGKRMLPLFSYSECSDADNVLQRQRSHHIEHLSCPWVRTRTDRTCRIWHRRHRSSILISISTRICRACDEIRKA